MKPTQYVASFQLKVTGFHGVKAEWLVSSRAHAAKAGRLGQMTSPELTGRSPLTGTSRTKKGALAQA
jgi:hypothetical protein